MKSYICVDIENDAVPETRYGRKAGNFLFDKIVAIGSKFGYGEAAIANCVIDENYIHFLLARVNVLVGHNLIHDLLFLWKYEELQEWLKDGGRIHDTMYAEYLLSGQQLTYKDLSLRKLAVEKYGCKEREKKMEKYWENGTKFLDKNGFILQDINSGHLDLLYKQWMQKTGQDQDDDINYPFDTWLEDNQGIRIINKPLLTSEIPKELVLEDVTNDVLDTEQIYLKQIEALEEAGMTNLFEGIMDFELATIEMTYNGMFINKEIFEKNKAALKQELLNREIEFLDKIRGIK